MRLSFRWLTMLALLGPGLLAGCRSLGGGASAPGVPPPATAGELAARFEQRQAPYKTLTARVDALAWGRFQRGKRRPTLLLLQAPPDRLSLRVDEAPLGPLLRVTQRGDHLGLHDVKNGVFYLGTGADLGGDGGFLPGVEPLDIVRVLLAEREAAEAVRALPPATLLPAPGFWRRHWECTLRRPSGASSTFRIRLGDGALTRVELTGPDGKRRLTAEYGPFRSEGGVWFPTEFLLSFSNGLRLRGTVASVKLDRPEQPGWFSLVPPQGLPVLPLTAWGGRAAGRPPAQPLPLR